MAKFVENNINNNKEYLPSSVVTGVRQEIDEYGKINTYVETTPTASIFGFATNQPITPEMASIGSKIISEMLNNNDDEED